MAKAVGEPSGENAGESGQLAPDSPARTREGMTPTDVFAAAQARDARQRQGAEALIAGFDRPGRSPRRARPSRDFVDYYASSKNSKPFVPQRNTEDELNSAVERVEGLAPRKGLPSWMRLVLVTLTACVLVTGVTYVATSDDPPPHRSPAGANTASLASAAVSAVRPPDDIPPPAAPNTVILPARAAPDPNAPALHPMTPSAPAERAKPSEPAPPATHGSPSPTTTQPSPSTAAPPPQTPPRDDFIRAL